MEDKIHKINFLSIGEQNQLFCLSSNIGIKTFNIDDFEEKSSSEDGEYKFGNISQVNFLSKYENFLVFVGSKKNTEYPPNTINIYNIEEDKIVFTKVFDKEITNFKCISDFIIIAFGKSLIIFLYDLDKNNLELKEEHKIEETSMFECWEEKQDQLLNNLYLAFPLEQELIIYYYTIREWSYGGKLNIISPVYEIQSLFYVKRLNQIFISDETAKYIYGIDVENGKIKLCLNRGKRPGFITSVALLDEGKFLAINNLDRTIHIFDLDIKNNAFSISNVFYGLIYNIQEIYPKMRIKYENILEKEEGIFFKNDFSEKGAILYCDNNTDLYVIAYNGIALKINIDLKNLTYKVMKKEEYAEKKIKIIRLSDSGCEFEKKKK